MNTTEKFSDTVASSTGAHDSDPDMTLGAMLGITALMCIVIAGLLWYMVPSIGQYPFTTVLTNSICIGLIAALLTSLVTGKLDQHRRASAPWLIALLIPVSTIAFFAGSTIANVILGLPLEPFSILASTSDTVSLIATVVATAICAGFFISRNRINRLKLQAVQDSHRVESARLAMLQAQIEPHMLFNTLANLRALIGVDPQRAVLMLDQLDAYLRMTLEGSRNSTNRLSTEFAGIEHYLAIMQIRLGERLSYSLDLPEQYADITVPSLLIQPVIENAIVHGIEPAMDGGHLSLSARMEKDVLTLDIIDTGVGSKLESQLTRPGGGFGLHSLRQRLPDIDGQAGVEIESPLQGRTNGTRVRLRMKT